MVSMTELRRFFIKSVLVLAWVLTLAVPSLTFASNDSVVAGSQLGQIFGRGPGSIPPLKPVPASLLVAGDEDSVWVARQVTIEGGDQKSHLGFQLWAHETGKRQGKKDEWWLVQIPGKPPVFRDHPALLLKIPAKNNVGLPGVPLIVMDDGYVAGYSLTERTDWPRIPLSKGEAIVAGVAGPDGVFVLTRGAAIAPATTTTTKPVATNKAGTIEIAPTTNVSAEPTLWKLYRLMGGQWKEIILGREGESQLPGPELKPVLLSHAGRVYLYWIVPGAPNSLHGRIYELTTTGIADVGIQNFDLSESVLRIQGVAIDSERYVLWTSQRQISENPPHNEALLQGLVITSNKNDKTPEAPKVRSLAPITIKGFAPDGDATRDISLVRTGNSLLAVLLNKDGSMNTLLLDNQGKILEGPLAIESGETPNSQIGENLLVACTIVLFLLALWRGNRKLVVVKIPAKTRLALLRLRVFAALIDLGCSIFVVVLAFGLYRDQQWMNLWARWKMTIGQPEFWFRAPELITIMSLYLAHVTISELLTGRTLGKTILGLRVIGMNGEKAQPVTIVIRNLIRIIEILMPLLLLYPYCNTLRQRLGDVIARSMVIQDLPQENPDDNH